MQSLILVFCKGLMKEMVQWIVQPKIQVLQIRIKYLEQDSSRFQVWNIFSCLVTLYTCKGTGVFNPSSVPIQKSRRITGGIPYIAHGAQITPPPLIFYFCISCFYALFRLGQVRVRLVPHIQELVGACGPRIRKKRGREGYLYYKISPDYPDTGMQHP